MRFYGLVTLGPTRTSKSSGMPYKTTMCDIKPTGIPEWRLLKELCENETSQKLLQDPADRFESKMAELKTKSV